MMGDKANLSLLLVIVCIICYYNAKDCGFAFDDASAIKDNKDLRPSTPISRLFLNDFWGTPMHKEKSHKSYRPLCVLTFRWNYAFNGLGPGSYHVFNIFLHAIVSVMFFHVNLHFCKQSVAFLAALMFSVHPIHTEAVTGVVGRAELLAAIFFFASMKSYNKAAKQKTETDWRWLVLTILLVSIGMLCKEQAITVIAVCCVFEVFLVQKLSFSDGPYKIFKTIGSSPSLMCGATRSLFLVATTLFLLYARIRVMGAQLPVFTKFDNPASAAMTPTRQLTFNYLLPVNIWLLLCPSGLCCDWTMGTVPLIQSILDVRNLATITFYIFLAHLVRLCLVSNRRSRTVTMALSLMIFPFIPALNLFFPVGFVVAERVLYLPSAGFSLLVSLGLHLLWRRVPRLLLVVPLAILLVMHSVKTVRRNADWYSEYTLFKSALRVNQKNAKLFNNVGHALETMKDYEQALKYFEAASKVQPDDIGAHMNVGRTYNTLKNFAAAEVAYRRALSLLPPVRAGKSYTARIAPNHLNVFLNLGNLLAKDDSRLAEADSLLRTAISMRADYTQAYINRGDILMRLNRSNEAIEQYHKALTYDEENADIHYNLGVVNLEQNRRQEAFDWFQRALKLDPDHRQSLFNLAVMIQESNVASLRPVAVSRLMRLKELEPKNEKVYFNLGMLAMDSKDFEDAEMWFKKAIEIKPDFRSALFNVALLIVNDIKKPLLAEPYLLQLLKFHPDHTKGLLLLGDVNINAKKDMLEAEKNFRQILSLEPENVQANHNLCVVYVEQGMLNKAENCLKAVARLAPDQTYILRHLAIVQNRIQKLRNQSQNADEKN